MTVPEPSSFELRHRTLERPIAIVFAPFGAPEPCGGGKYLINVLRIVGPVGRDMNGAARLEFVSAKVEKPWLDDPTLVMPLFRPRVGKIQIDTPQAC